MDKVKDALGMDKREEEKTTEPVSGQTGEGNTSQPFDQGNNPQATQSAVESTEQTVPIATTNTTETTAGQTSASTGLYRAYDGLSTTPATVEESSPGPHTSVPTASTNTTANATTAGQTSASTGLYQVYDGLSTNQPTSEKSSSGPQLPSAVQQMSAHRAMLASAKNGEQTQAGPSTELGGFTPVPDLTLNDRPANKDTNRMIMTEGVGSSSSATSSGYVPGSSAPTSAAPTDNTNRSMSTSSGSRQNEMRGSRIYSVASPAADKSRKLPLKADNPGRIPTAGGIPIGGVAMADRERRKSQWTSGSTSEDPTASGSNTQTNYGPVHPINGKAPMKEDKPVFATSMWADQSNSSNAAPVVDADERRPANVNQVPAELKPETPAASNPSTNSNNTAQAMKSPVTPSSASASKMATPPSKSSESPASTSDRRSSLFGSIKNKLRGSR